MRARDASDMLVAEFQDIKKKHHKKAIISTIARSILGSSVIRVYRKKSKTDLQKALESVNIDKLKAVQTEAQFKRWFTHELDILARAILKINRGKRRLGAGYKWGHTTKLLNLLLTSA